MNKFRITLTGTAPLIMHNARMSNPLDPSAQGLKKATGKRTKTTEDHEMVAHLEWLGSLYHDPDMGPYVPGDNIWRCLFDAAKKFKKGPRIKEGVVISSTVNPLSYRGPRTVEELWADGNFRLDASVKVQTSRLMRCRPIFRDWRCDAEGILDPGALDPRELTEIAEVAGTLIGLCDWRPRNGRFEAEVDML